MDNNNTIPWWCSYTIGGDLNTIPDIAKTELDEKQGPQKPSKRQRTSSQENLCRLTIDFRCKTEEEKALLIANINLIKQMNGLKSMPAAVAEAIGFYLSVNGREGHEGMVEFVS